jgi:hypothetical protein
MGPREALNKRFRWKLAFEPWLVFRPASESPINIRVLAFRASLIRDSEPGSSGEWAEYFAACVFPLKRAQACTRLSQLSQEVSRCNFAQD